MKEKCFVLICSVLILSLCGCGRLTEFVKGIWGSSTQSLGKARLDALSKIYQCQYSDCFDAGLKAVQNQGFQVFLKDKKKQHIVLMGIPGNIDTTEVGVFFVKVTDDAVRIEVTSLSQHAKEIVAERLFNKLNEIYSEVK